MSTKDYHNHSDADLLKFYKSSGSNKWLGILLERYHLLVFGVCYKYVRDEENAKDCVQQIFEKVLKELEKYEVTYFKSWLFMIAKNHCLMQIRAKKLPVSSIEIHFAETPAEPDAKASAISKEQNLNSLEEALLLLNAEQKECITLFYLHKKSYNEIAECTHLSLLQVKSNIQNGKRNLKNLMIRRTDNE